MTGIIPESLPAMTVPSEQSRIQYTTDGTSVSFPVPFRFLNAAHLQVARQHNDKSSILELGVDYSVSGVGNQAGGTITTTTTLPAGDTISIERVVPITQETAYQRNDPFPERAHEQALDKLTMICQMLGGVLGLTPGSINRALLLGAADIDGSGAYRANGNRIQDVGDPVLALDAINKKTLLEYLANLSVDGSGQFVVERLADASDPDGGTNMIAWKRDTLPKFKSNNLTQTLNATRVNVWEFQHLISDRPNLLDFSSWDWHPAFQAAALTNLAVDTPEGGYTLKSPVKYTSKNSFSGRGIRRTNIYYKGQAGTSAFEHEYTGDGSDQWPGRVTFSDMTIHGDGDGHRGANAVVGGISCGDDLPHLVNIPYYTIQKVEFRRCKTGLYLEGYGHTLIDVWAEQCFTGIEFVHPEQNVLINCWANYCDTGLIVNKRKLKYGHRMNIIGGAFQRCRVGMELWNFGEADINTYFELNELADIQLGDMNDGNNYHKGCKNTKIRSNTVGNSDPASRGTIQGYASVGLDVDFVFVGSSAGRTQPNVYTNGSSKYTVVQYNKEAVGSTNPWVFEGYSASKSYAHPIGESGEEVRITLESGVTGELGSTPSVRKTSANTALLTINARCNSSTRSRLGVLPAGFRPSSPQSFACAAYNTASGSWFQNPATMQINISGEIVFTNSTYSKDSIINLVCEIPLRVDA
ncbi:hypothetical protein [Paenalcaligenes suwonensis]|uniref:hypothetical protein n=1 Tax=Paenalcaligenes suwonensis TaxID=1202713 RepID=UPI00140C4932|nr:hypothetical protein [Paenalcaligenes suwonensis]NHC63174.1 hypothetical protein [Paenalcaligenes suwonensis]